MKSLILKDLYNIAHNAKSMILMLLVFAVILIPLYGSESYVISSGVLCSMMIITTFNFDDNCKWEKYAMIMPVSKNDLVAAKFIVLLIFSLIGAVSGFFLGTIGGLLTRKLSFHPESILSLLFVALLSLVIAEILGSMTIPLVIKFGAERGRMLLLVSFMVPAAICFLLYLLLQKLNVTITEQMMFNFICLSPVIALLWNVVMYQIGYRIFSKQEF